MTLDEYLQRHGDARKLTLVGPMDHSANEIQEPVIFVDGGTASRKSDEGIAVGDGDSFPGDLDVLLEADKDFSDLAYALNRIPQSFDDLRLWGFMGGRVDHQMINIGEVHNFLEQRTAPARVELDKQILGFSSGQWKFEHHGTFSTMAVAATRITLDGACRYQCVRMTRFEPLSSLGLSNVGSGTISLQCEGPVFILLTDQTGAG